jgi:thiosulfate/3-mercaptopyruvate sulfurtransferase
MKSLLLILLAIITFFSSSFSQEVPILVTPQWLNDHQKDPNVVIVQVNFMKIDYADEHIAGARYLWPGWLAPDSPEGAMNEPDLTKAGDMIGSLGISNNSHVILCHVRGEVSPTARMFLTFEHLGMKGRVSFLNGGLDAWKKAGYAVTKELPVYKPGKFKVKINPVIVDRHYVQNHLHSDSVTIVDARMTRFYNGEATGNPRDGHITGAKNIPYTEMVDATNVFKPNDQLQAYFTAVTDTKDKELVTYCFIGQTASVVYMAGRILGYPMKLYDGSLQEWSRIKELPMEITEKKESAK